MADVSGKKIIFCLPGKTYSGEFLCSFLELNMHLVRNGANVRISQKYSPCVNAVRCMVAGADLMSGEYQRPFRGLEYDYMMWIDSDIVFNTESFYALMQMDKDIASGWYAQPNNFTPVVEEMDDEFFLANGRYNFLRSEELTNRKEPFKVAYTGFGWLLMKQGVLEQMKYPWFAPRIIKINEKISEITSEDVGFCLDAKNAGFDIWVNPRVRVGHEKSFTI